MRIADKTMKQPLEEILEKYHFRKRDSKAKTGIELTESHFNKKLPEDYVFFLENYFEFEDFINVEYVKLWALEDLTEINRSYEVQKYIPEIIAIGSNGAGEIIGIESKGSESGPIILTPAEFDKENNIEIGSNFSDFLFRLDQGKGWFD